MEDRYPCTKDRNTPCEVWDDGCTIKDAICPYSPKTPNLDRSGRAAGYIACPFCGGKPIESERGSGEYTMCSTEPLWENENGCPIGQMCIPTDRWEKRAI